MFQRKHRSSIYELGSPNVVNENDISKTKNQKTHPQCSCKVGRGRKGENEWTFTRNAENAIDYYTVLLEKRTLWTGNSLWYFNTYGHDKSCCFKDMSSGALEWKKLPISEKKVHK